MNREIKKIKYPKYNRKEFSSKQKEMFDYWYKKLMWLLGKEGETETDAYNVAYEVVTHYHKEYGKKKDQFLIVSMKTDGDVVTEIVLKNTKTKYLTRLKEIDNP